MPINIVILKGTFTIASWRGTKDVVKKLRDELFTDKDKVRAFRDELEFHQKIRHPNVVQFLGADDLRLFLKRKGALKHITEVYHGYIKLGNLTVALFNA
ncbi:integrin-linked protein kinase 1-like protein [Tanacetum coccineum]